MSEIVNFERCKSFIDCQISTANLPLPKTGSWERPAVTLSRQAGSGGRTIADKLAAFLNEHDTDLKCPWTVFDRNLVGKVLEDHHLPARLAQFMKEEKGSEIDAGVREMLGLHPSLWTLVHYTTDTILRLARIGNVILVGRGASVITRSLKNCFHARLVGSLAQRLENVREYYSLSAKAARAFLDKEDRQRKRYLKKYFGEDIDDPLLYHLVINTDLVSSDEAAQIIGAGVLRRKAKETRD